MLVGLAILFWLASKKTGKFLRNQVWLDWDRRPCPSDTALNRRYKVAESLRYSDAGQIIEKVSNAPSRDDPLKNIARNLEVIGTMRHGLPVPNA